VNAPSHLRPSVTVGESRLASVSVTGDRAYHVLSPPTSVFVVTLALFGALPNFRWEAVFPASEDEQLDAAADSEDAVTPSMELRSLQRDEATDTALPVSSSAPDIMPNVPKDGWLSPGSRRLLIRVLRAGTYLYSGCVFALMLALWIRVLQFRNYRHEPVEKIAYGVYYILPLLAVVRSWYVYGYRGDHFQYVWDVVAQENSELATEDRANAALLQPDNVPAATAEDNVTDAVATEDADLNQPEPPRRASGQIIRTVTVVQPDQQPELPGLHHSRKRFLSLAWTTVDRTFGTLSLVVIFFIWLPVNLHLFRPLVTGEAPSEIDWLAAVPPDELDNRLLGVSVSGYCFVLMLGSYYQVASMFMCLNMHCMFGAMLTTRAERLFRRTKLATGLPAKAQTIWMQHVAHWRKRLRSYNERFVINPHVMVWLQVHAALVVVYTVLFGALLLYTGGDNPRIVIFLASVSHMGAFALQSAVNDKGATMLRRAEMQAMANTLGRLDSAEVVSSTAATYPEQPGKDKLIAVDSASFAKMDRSLVASPSADGTTIQHHFTTLERQVSKEQLTGSQPAKRASVVLREYGILHPMALIPRLLPAMWLQGVGIAVVWIALVVVRSWLNYLECSRNPETYGFLDFDFTRCSTSDFLQITIEAALTSYVCSRC